MSSPHEVFRKGKRILLCVSFIALILGSLSTQSAVYRWVDKDGRVQFSDRPQQGSSSTEVELGETNAVKGMDRKRQRQQKRMLQIYDEDRQQEVNDQRQQVRSDEKNCKSARHNLGIYTRGGTYSRRGEDGNRIYLSEQEVQKKIDHWQGLVSRYCQ